MLARLKHATMSTTLARASRMLFAATMGASETGLVLTDSLERGARVMV